MSLWQSFAHDCHCQQCTDLVTRGPVLGGNRQTSPLSHAPDTQALFNSSGVLPDLSSKPPRRNAARFFSENEIAELVDHFGYDPSTGLFTRPGRVGPFGGTRTKIGYLAVSFKHRSILAHRLAWLLHYRANPNEIDHINGDRSDNRIENLRNVSRKENLRNARSGKVNKLAPGVHRLPWGFVTRIKIDGKAKWLGTFATLQEAAAAYAKAKIELHGYCREEHRK